MAVKACSVAVSMVGSCGTGQLDSFTPDHPGFGVDIGELPVPGWSSHRAARCSERLPGVRADVLADLRRRAGGTTTATSYDRKESRDRARLLVGGPAGLGTAYRLRDSGLDVKVLDVQPDPAAGPGASGSSDRPGRVYNPVVRAGAG